MEADTSFHEPRRFGYWRVRAEDGPVVQDFIDAEWKPHDLDKIVQYLSKSPLYFAIGCPSYCTICKGVELLAGSRSDGAWLWPPSLSHYVTEHHVRLPDRMLKHIRDSEYRIVELDEIDEDKLDIPGR